MESALRLFPALFGSLAISLVWLFGAKWTFMGVLAWTGSFWAAVPAGLAVLLSVPMAALVAVLHLVRRGDA